MTPSIPISAHSLTRLINWLILSFFLMGNGQVRHPREREREMDMELCTCNHWNLTVAIVVMLLPLVLTTNKILALFFAVYP